MMNFTKNSKWNQKWPDKLLILISLALGKFLIKNAKHPQLLSAKDKINNKMIIQLSKQLEKERQSY